MADDPVVEHFLKFMDAGDVAEILACFSDLCREAGLESEQRSQESFYSALKQRMKKQHHRPTSLFEILDKRAAREEYCQQSACRGMRVLVVGAGPVGLRAAVEAVLLGAMVDLVEKRDGFTRNNVLHLWSYVVADLKSLGIKKFVGQFGTGGIDHISILKLQCFLLKTCLLLGVRYHSKVTFDSLQEPKSASNSGWTVKVSPASCPVSGHTYDAIIAADGKKRSLPGFPADVFRGSLAIGITANFVIHGTEEELAADEIAGVASHFHPGFFKSLKEKHGIHLENIVYYRDKTHYFVMTAKRESLLGRGVIKQLVSGGAQALLASTNIDHSALERYAVDAATFATKGQLGKLEFVKNQSGKNDVSIFDFTALSKAKHAARIVERKNKKILLCIAGDSLNEPFWPTGSGIAHGFLGANDAAWMLKRYAEGVPPLELIEERESLFHALPSTTNDKMPKGDQYTIDPRTRYPHYNNLPVPPSDVSYLYDSDTKPPAPVKPRPATAVKKQTLAPEKPKRNRSFTARDPDNNPTYKEIQNRFKEHTSHHHRPAPAPPRPKPVPASSSPKRRPASASSSSRQKPVSGSSPSKQRTPPQRRQASPAATPEIKSEDRGSEAIEQAASSGAKAASPGMLKKFTMFISGLFKRSSPSPQRSPQRSPRKTPQHSATQDLEATTRRPAAVRPASAGGRVQDRIQLFSSNEQSQSGSGVGGATDLAAVVPRGLVAGRMQALKQAYEETDSTGRVEVDGAKNEEEDQPFTAMEEYGISDTELEELVMFFVNEFEPPAAHLKHVIERKQSKDDIQVSLQEEPDMVSDWQTRFSARLNMSLTCLRNQTDLLTVRTTLHILSMIYSNAQEYDDEHSYRCVRVTSSLFARHVWCFPEAQQFLLQSGWIETDKYISLPLGLNLDLAIDVLDKHVYIVDQLLWSRRMGGDDVDCDVDLATTETSAGDVVMIAQKRTISLYDNSPDTSDNEEEQHQELS